MEFSKKHILIPAILIIVIAFIAGSYLYHLHNTRPALSAFRAVSGDAAVVFQARDAGRLRSALATSDLWKAMTRINGVQKVEQMLSYVDSTLRKDENNRVSEDPHRILVTLTFSKEQTAEVLFLVESMNMGQADKIKRYLHHMTGGSPPKTTSYSGTTIYSVKPDAFPYLLYYAFDRGLLALAFQPESISKALGQAASGHSLAQDTVFSRLTGAAGKNATASVFINNRFIPLLINLTISEKDSIALALMKDFAGWSEFDLNINDREWLLNGFTSAGTGDFLSLFRNQGEGHPGIAAVLPYHTSFILDFIFHDPDTFLDDFTTFLADHNLQRPYQQRLDTILSRKGMDLPNEMRTWGIEEAGMAVIDNIDNPVEGGTVIVIKTGNKDKCLRSLRMLSDTARDHRAGSDGTEAVLGIPVMKLDVTVPWDYYFRPFTGKRAMRYYAVLGDAVIFSASPGVLREVITRYRYRRTLANDALYSNFYRQLPERSIIYLFLNIRRLLSTAESLTSPRFTAIVEDNRDLFMNMEGLSIQYNSLDDLFYSNIFLKYNPAHPGDATYTWVTTLDTVVRSGPFLVKRGDEKGHDLFCTDQAGTLYRIDATGTILWKVGMDEDVLSGIFPVKAGEGQAICYLFNTPSNLCLVDSGGGMLPGYPVTLPSRATSGLILTEPEGKTGPMLLYAGEDNRLYAIDIWGKVLPAWGLPNLGSRLSAPVVHLTVKKEDRYIAACDDGDVVIADRKGKVLYRTPPGFVHARHGGFYVNRTNSKGDLLTTDAAGNLSYLPGKTIPKVTFGHYTPDHYFIYHDFNGDGDPDFIYIDGKNLSVFNRFKKNLFSFTFDEKVKDPPVIVTTHGKETLLGVVTREDDRVYLFNKSGLIPQSRLIKGHTPFVIGTVTADTVPDLVIGQGHNLLDYRLEGF
jgi:hypothetical protein